ncbi:hypothetical protein FKW77_001565 [Venturia effusa]|uniref:Ubiquitin carboxyl-terminal hydrolase n=1 Tax=Venturia effusa TaxID=50376 RepID=A0A517LAF3_9PEZI|nr:hypothetical protein FKW77_001565 [Venturia effusa]
MDPHAVDAPKIWVPLENNPSVMTPLAHNLGLSPSLHFIDVYSLTEPSLLRTIPRPVHALLFLYPGTVISARDLFMEEEDREEYTASGPDEPVLWFRQTIGHACGLIGLLHCVTNGEASKYILPGSELENLVKAATPLNPTERAKLLYDSEVLEKAHKEAAEMGYSRTPGIEEPVLYGFTAFVKGRDGRLYELEGQRKGPVERGVLEEGEDVLS